MELDRLEELLKKKGIGPQGSKSLTFSEVNELEELFTDPDFSLITKATMLVALLILEPNQEELKLINKIKAGPSSHLPEEIIPFLQEKSNDRFFDNLLHVIDKQDLSYDEAAFCMEEIIAGRVEDYLKASFLEGQRLKRETFDENKAFFDVLSSHTKSIKVHLPVLIDICDAYDGSNRTMNFTPFIAATLASMGFPTVIHGVDKVAPKQGYTAHVMLKEAGKNPLLSPDKVASQITDKTVGWGYIDQSVFLPEVEAMKQMRKELVKRPFLATFEKLLQPIRSDKGNYIVTGYTHKHYRDEVPNQLKAQGLVNRALVLRGVEGSTALNMSRASEGILFDGQAIHEIQVDPMHYGIEYLDTVRDTNINYREVVKQGIAALNGVDNYAAANIKYTVSLILENFQLMSAEEVKQETAQVLSDGRALSHWNNHS